MVCGCYILVKGYQFSLFIAEAESSSGSCTHGTEISDGDSAASASSAHDGSEDSTGSGSTDHSGSVGSDHVNVLPVQCTEVNQQCLQELSSAGLNTKCFSTFEHNYLHPAKFVLHPGLSTTRG